MITMRRDSDGNNYQVWRQTQMNSCAVASTWTARNLVRQQTMSEGEWGLAQRFYRAAVRDMFAPIGVDPSGPMSLDPGAFPQDKSSMASTIANIGFVSDEIVRALRNEGIVVDVERARARNPLVLKPHLLGDMTPAIVAVFWDSGGGHAIVAARAASSGRIVYLDPWDASLTEQSNNGRYNAPYGGSGRIGIARYLAPARSSALP